jgi:hypothetical protein
MGSTPRILALAPGTRGLPSTRQPLWRYFCTTATRRRERARNRRAGAYRSKRVDVLPQALSLVFGKPSQHVIEPRGGGGVRHRGAIMISPCAVASRPAGRLCAAAGRDRWFLAMDFDKATWREDAVAYRSLGLPDPRRRTRDAPRCRNPDRYLARTRMAKAVDSGAGNARAERCRQRAQGEAGQAILQQVA